VGVLVAAVIAAGVSVGVALGRRSSKGGGPAPGAGPAYRVQTVFTPTTPVPTAQLRQTAHTMYERLRAVGDTGVAVSCCGRAANESPGSGPSITVSSPRPLSPAERSLVAAEGSLWVRPVLCGAPAYRTPSTPVSTGASTGSSSSTALAACGAAYQTTSANLGISPDPRSTNGYMANLVQPDPAFASYPSTPVQDDDPSATVLLPADPAAGPQQYPRFVLGPAQMGSDAVASASAVFDRDINEWTVNVTLTASGAAQYDNAAETNFHRYMAIDLNGRVLSAPIIEPTQASFVSLGGRLVISGSFSAAGARDIAALIGNGPLAVRLVTTSVARVPVHS
jgi:hypothetical protein